MTIVVKATHELARYLGGYRQELRVERSLTVSGLIELLSERYGIEVRNRLANCETSLWNVAVFVNGRNVLFGQGRGRDTVIRDGDEVFFLSPISGG